MIWFGIFGFEISDDISLLPKMSHFLKEYTLNHRVICYVCVTKFLIRLSTVSFLISYTFPKSRFFTKITFSKSHFSQKSLQQNLTFHKNHISKIPLFTKITFSKPHFSQNSHFQKLLFSHNSHFQDLIFHKIHIFLQIVRYGLECLSDFYKV